MAVDQIGFDPHIMSAHNRLSWLSVILAGTSYGFIGIVFALPSSNAHTWRLAAWVISGAVYLTHVAYELWGLHNSRLASALHAAMAAAVGAFLLAVGATVHAAMVPSHAPYWRFVIALVVWPIITAVPAFLVGFVLGSLLKILCGKEGA